MQHITEITPNMINAATNIERCRLMRMIILGTAVYRSENETNDNGRETGADPMLDMPRMQQDGGARIQGR